MRCVPTTVPILQIRKLRQRKVKGFDHSHKPSKRQTQDLDSGPPDSKVNVLSHAAAGRAAPTGALGETEAWIQLWPPHGLASICSWLYRCLWCLRARHRAVVPLNLLGLLVQGIALAASSLWDVPVSCCWYMINCHKLSDLK